MGSPDDLTKRAEQVAQAIADAAVNGGRTVLHRVLGVPEGPVVSEAAAAAMATGVAQLLGAELAVAVTGVGGPEPQDGQQPGTVWFAVSAGETVTTELRRWEGRPEEVLDHTTVHALDLLERALSVGTAPS